MVGTIEELEKEIDQFQKNILASSELVVLLSQMLEQIQVQNTSFEQKSDALISKIDTFPTSIEAANSESNQRIKKDVSSELTLALQEFKNEQNRYLSDLEQTRKQIQIYIDCAESRGKQFEKESRGLLDKIDSSIAQIRDDNIKENDRLKTEFDKVLAERNEELAAEQQKYIDSIQQSEKTIKSAEGRICETYKEFIGTIEKMNISNLYEQNQQLRNELSKRTNILTVIAVLSVVVGIVGLFI